MSTLTPQAEGVVAALVPWIILGALVFVAYALSEHIGWRDAAACTIVFWMTTRSLRMAGRPV